MEISKEALFDRMHPLIITVVGAGGTGSQVMRELGRIHHAMLKLGMMGLMVNLVDDDKVSDANVGRQLFAQCEVGEHKSRILIERANRIFGCLWEHYPYKIGEDGIGVCNDAHIVISCVDNTQARKILQNRFRKGQIYYNASWGMWIDAGNTKFMGQVIVGTRQLNQHKIARHDYRGVIFPTAVDLHPDMVDSGINEPSCSLAEALAEQDLFINSYVAMEIGNLLWNIVFHKRIPFIQSYINLTNAGSPIARITPERYHELRQLQDEENTRGDKTKSADSSGQTSKRTRSRRVRSDNNAAVGQT